ncbi:MAG: multidrug effflux MFS transporter [Maritimibacter sp.]
MTSPLLKTAAILAAMSMVGPFAIDMYLPALPAIAHDLKVPEVAVHNTITFYFIAVGLAQLIYGPWSDMVGRKLPIYVGLSIFAVGSLWAAMAPQIETLVMARFLQGIGGAVTMVVPRAIVRDQYRGTEATRLMALIMLVISVSPMLAPLAGSGVIALVGWRGVFGVMVVATVICLVLAATAQPETLAKTDRVPINFRALLRGSKVLFRSRVFMGLTFIGAFGMGSFFVFISFAPFVYAGQYGLSPTQFSLLFAFNALGFFATSQIAAPLSERYGERRVMSVGTAGFAGFTALLFVIALMGGANLWVLTACLLIGNGFMGLVIPTSMVMALEDHGDIAGLASSMGGTLQMLTGGALVLLAGPFFDGTATPMTGMIAFCAAISFVLALTTLGALKAAR